jgi:hypothetical protein
MRNSVSLSASGQSISFSPSITTSYTRQIISAAPAVATISSSLPDFAFASNSHSPAYLQITTSLSTKDLPSTAKPAPCTGNCHGKEADVDLKRGGTEGVEVTGGSMQRRSVIHSGGGNANPPKPLPPQADAVRGTAQSAVLVPAAGKPFEQEVDKPAQKNTATQPAAQAKPVSDSKKYAPGDQPSQDSPPISPEAGKEMVAPEDPVAKPTPAAQPIPQQPVQADVKPEVKDSASAQKSITKTEPAQSQTVAKTAKKEKPRVVWIQKKPIQLFGRPHVHHTEMKKREA